MLFSKCLNVEYVWSNTILLTIPQSYIKKLPLYCSCERGVALYDIAGFIQTVCTKRLHFICPALTLNQNVQNVYCAFFFLRFYSTTYYVMYHTKTYVLLPQWAGELVVFFSSISQSAQHVWYYGMCHSVHHASSPDIVKWDLWCWTLKMKRLEAPPCGYMLMPTCQVDACQKCYYFIVRHLCEIVKISTLSLKISMINWLYLICPRHWSINRLTDSRSNNGSEVLIVMRKVLSYSAD